MIDLIYFDELLPECFIVKVNSHNCVINFTKTEIFQLRLIPKD